MVNAQSKLLLVAGLILALARPNGAAAADDTFACLSREGPSVSAQGNGAYSKYIAEYFQPGTRFDARSAWWRHQTWPSTVAQNASLLQLGNRETMPGPACWAGGLIVGTTPRDTSWYRLKSGAAGGGIVIHANGMVVDGTRMDNIFGESAILIPRGPNFDLRNLWVSHVVDDCIENDHKENGRIIDSLFDGCYMGLSIDNRYETARPGNNIVLDRVLMHLREVDMTNRPYDTWGTWIKTTANAGGEVGLKIYDSIFTFSDRTPEKYTNRIARAWQNVRECRNNVIAWLPDGPMPVIPRPPSCFRIEMGQAARELWAAAKQNWINCHPLVARAPNDPQSDVSRCDPNAYGGDGEAVTPPPPPPDLLTYISKRADIPPVVDGNLQEFAGAPIARLGDHTVMVLWDDQALYIGATVADTQLIASISGRDGDLWTEDSFEIFLDPGRTGGSRMTDGDVQFMVSPLRTQWDGDDLGRLWDAEWWSAVSLTGVGYTVELAIPWSALGVTPAIGATHGFAFAIDDKDPTTQTRRIWGGATGGFKMPDRWGVLTLGDVPLEQVE